MTSKSNPLDSNTVSTTYSPPDGGSIKTNDGTKRVQPMTSKSKCAIAAFVVGDVAGVVIVILGITNLFGPVGSIGYIVSIAVGGTAAVIAIGGLIWIVISKCKQSDNQQHSTLTNRMNINRKTISKQQKEDLQTSGTKKDHAVSQLSSIASFGADCWKRYYGKDIGAEPPLPKNIETILHEPCPYFRGKQVWQTHCLVLVPGEPFTWPMLRTLVPNTLQLGDARIFDAPETICIQQEKQNSHWVLMLKEPVPGSCNQHMNRSLAQNKDKEDKYKMPTLMEATIAILAHYTLTDERLFSTTEIYCDERGRQGNLRIGCFGTDGLHIRLHDQDWIVANRGIGALRVL